MLLYGSHALSRLQLRAQIFVKASKVVQKNFSRLRKKLKLNKFKLNEKSQINNSTQILSIIKQKKGMLLI